MWPLLVLGGRIAHTYHSHSYRDNSRKCIPPPPKFLGDIHVWNCIQFNIYKKLNETPFTL